MPMPKLALYKKSQDTVLRLRMPIVIEGAMHKLVSSITSGTQVDFRQLIDTDIAQVLSAVGGIKKYPTLWETIGNVEWDNDTLKLSITIAVDSATKQETIDKLETEYGLSLFRRK